MSVWKEPPQVVEEDDVTSQRLRTHPLDYDRVRAYHARIYDRMAERLADKSDGVEEALKLKEIVGIIRDKYLSLMFPDPEVPMNYGRLSFPTRPHQFREMKLTDIFRGLEDVSKLEEDVFRFEVVLCRALA